MSLAEKQPFEKSKKAVILVETEEERLLRDIYRPDMEKFKLFMQMLRTNDLYKKAKITHK